MKIKRFTAYIIDIILVYFVANAIFIICFNNDYKKFQKSTDEYVETLKKTMSNTKEKQNAEELIAQTNKINYDYLKSGQTQTIIVLTIEIIYFVFMQYFNKGQTIGKKLMKIRIKQQEGKKLDASQFVLREAVLFVLPVQIIDVICLLTTKMNTYLTINSVTSNINSLVTITIIAFVLFRKDERGLHEIVSKTEMEQL